MITTYVVQVLKEGDWQDWSFWSYDDASKAQQYIDSIQQEEMKSVFRVIKRSTVDQVV